MSKTTHGYEVGETGPAVIVKNLEMVDFVKYAGASGDFHPVHYDEEFTEEAGYSDVFAHGMLTAGIASRFLTDWFGIGQLQRFRTRFEDVVWRGDSLHVSGEIITIDQENGSEVIEVAFEVENQHGEIVLSGDATVAP